MAGSSVGLVLGRHGKMSRSVFPVLAALLGVAVPAALAEDVTVTTYYPSPRGVYEQLRTTNTTNLATDGGSVGIGTTSPSAKLDIVGDSKFNGQMEIVGNHLFLLGTNGSDPAGIIGALYYNTTTNQFKGYNGTWNILEDNWVLSGADLYTGPAVTGNVGIGDTSPLALLTVGNGDLFRVDSTGHVNTIAGTAALPAFSFTGDTNTGIYSGGANILRFATNAADRVTIDAAGRVGIGTTAPEAFTPLSIHSNIPLHLRLQTDAGTQGPHIDLVHAGQAGGQGYQIGSSGTGNYPGRSGVFEIYYQATSADVLVIDGPAGGLVGIGTIVPKNRLDVVGGMAVGAPYAGTSAAPANGLIVGGNVGIGTATPAQELEVGSPTGGNTHIKITANSANVSGLDFSDMAGAFAQGGVEYWHQCEGMLLYTLSGSFMELMGGRVGIGSSFLGCDPIGYTLAVQGNAANTTGVWSVMSDERLKKNVQSLEGALDKVSQLRGVTFEWREPEKHGNQAGPRMGLIAQEVEGVLPQWVGTNDDGYKDLTMTGFEALAIEAIKELRAEVTALKADNEGLSKRVEALEHSR